MTCRYFRPPPMNAIVTRTLACVLLLACAGAFADTLYKSVGPDGRVVYSDRPPAEGAVARTLTFDNLPASPLPESVLRYRRDLEKSAGKRLADAAAPRPAGGVELFTAQWCGYCRQAKAYLAAKNISYREYDIDTPEGKEAYARTSGNGIPVLLSGERKLVGFSRAAYDSLFARR